MNAYLIGWGLLIVPIVAIYIAFVIWDKVEKKKQSHMTLGRGRRMDDGRVGDGAVFQQDAFVLQQAVHGLEEF